MNAMKYSDAELDRLLRNAAEPVARGWAHSHSAQVMFDRIVATPQQSAAEAQQNPMPATDAQAIAYRCLPPYASILFAGVKLDLDAARKVIGERRGRYGYLYVATGRGGATCLRDSKGVVHNGSVFATPVELGTKGVELQGWGELKTDEGCARLMAGHLGSDVIGVDIAPKGKPIVHATISDGYFLAWYPEVAPGHGGDPVPTTVTLRLKGGGTVADLNPGDLMDEPYLGR